MTDPWAESGRGDVKVLGSGSASEPSITPGWR